MEIQKYHQRTDGPTDWVGARDTCMSKNADADAVTPSINTRSYTRRSIPSSLGRSFLKGNFYGQITFYGQMTFYG